MGKLKKERIDKLLYAIAGAYFGYFVLHPIITAISYSMLLGNTNLFLILVTSFNFRMIPWALSFTLLGAALGYLYGSIREKMEELMYANGVKELLIDILHHDLATPLSTARLNAELYIKKRKDEYMQRLIKALDDMQRIITESRNFARIESTEDIFKSVDLVKIIEDAIDEVTPLAEEKNLKIKFYPKGKAMAEVSGTFRLAITNLLTNAIKYTPPGSEVRVDIQDRVNSYVIAVADQGEGIPEDKKAIIFRRFERLPSAVKGTGLGLAIVKRVVDVHSGRAWVEDNKPRGSIFKIEIPKKQ